MKSRYSLRRLSALWAVGFFLFSASAINSAAKAGESKKLTLASTTSTMDSGLFDALIPPFEKKYGCKVKVIAVGSGQAIRLARDGNADVLLVHDRASEEKFVADGFGPKRYDVMYNDFIIVGPSDDPAGAEGLDVAEALRAFAQKNAAFVSRGDDSGTHKKERALWKAAAVEPPAEVYMESGSGMEVTLRIAEEKPAYTLTDRATWLAHKKELVNLSVISEGSALLLNPYSVIAVSDKKYPHVNRALAERFISFITGKEGQNIIKNYGVEKYGGPLFFPDAKK
ncbi:MAG: tungsten ABC transporter substrate-binding protein [Elusimicrobia bacterium HGW-Elusimicrobia-1]|jgi:tungstate transport system substrate-binding protein|nr:MAG: tungsten ABC transporter substrate-binding protein [Elusimicrobia bacterium HGW-Elusimicrobia-1]